MRKDGSEGVSCYSARGDVRTGSPNPDAIGILLGIARQNGLNNEHTCS